MNTGQFTTILAAFVLSLILVSLVAAQDCPWSVKPNWISLDPQPTFVYTFTTSVALSDLDNDEDLDLVVGKYKYPYLDNLPDDPGTISINEIGGGLFAYQNVEGEMAETATLLAGGLGLDGLCVDCIAMGDYDNDGDMDAAVGCVVGKGNDGGVWVFENQYVDPNTIFENLFRDDDPAYYWHPTGDDASYDCHCVRWVDVDGDGWLDLAALEVPGTIHIYLNDGQGNLVSNSQITLPIYDEIISQQNGQPTRDLSNSSINYPLAGTTMEFGDMDGDEDLDLYTNVNGKPTIYKNMGIETVYYNTGDFWQAASKKQQSCASFGYIDGGDVLSLAIGSAAPFGEQGDCGNTIYMLSEGALSEITTSEVDLDTPPQMVTDIQWGFIDAGNTPDLVAVSYPWYRKDETTGNHFWERGREQIHLNPTQSIDPMSTYIWTSGELGYSDLSTSLALGDLDYGNYSDIVEGPPPSAIAPTQRLIYVQKFPFVRLMEVSFRDANNNILAIWPPYQQYPVVPVTYDPINGWISIDRAFDVTGANYIKVRYKYGQNLDLAVGNDGHDVIYYNDETGSEENEPLTPDLSVNFPFIQSPVAYQPPAWGNEPIDLMAKDAVGAFTNGNTFLEKLPNCRMMSEGGSWPVFEMFRGHYFWDRLDKSINQIAHLGSDYKCALFFGDTPKWTMGNYDPEPPAWPNNDYKLRTSDERLHTLFVRNVVNRYRPEGLFNTQGYNWGDWGVQHFQFEFEADWAEGDVGHGYGCFQESYEALAEKQFREYQIIKKISNDAYTNDPDKLKVISVHATMFWPRDEQGNLLEGNYLGPNIPFFNAVNEVDLTLINPPGTPDRVLWRYCDYLYSSNFCAIVQVHPEAADLTPVDPFISIYADPGTNLLPLGVDHTLWGFYTEGLEAYYQTLYYPEADWWPVMRDAHSDTIWEKPFFLTDWQFSNVLDPGPNVPENNVFPQADWISSQVAKLQAVDVFPAEEGKDHYLVEYQTSWISGYYPDVINQMAGLLNDLDPEGPGKTFLKLEEPTPPGTNNPKVHIYTFCPRNLTSPTQANNWINFLRTDYSPPLEADRYVKDAYTYRRSSWYNYNPGLYRTGQPANCITSSGNQFNKSCNVQTDMLDDLEPPPYYLHWFDIPFAPGEIGPQMQIIGDITITGANNEDFSQTIQLHPKWNLVSWNLDIPDPNPEVYPYYLEMDEILPGPPGWLWTNPGGRVHTWESGSQQAYPDWEGSEGWEWNPYYAYYLFMNGSHTWTISDQPHLPVATISMEPKGAWSTDLPLPDATMLRWFFLGYTTNGYMKLASLPSTTDCNDGNPANFAYEGPFHWLIWHQEAGQQWQQYQPWDLKAVRTDEGKWYLPNPDQPQNYVDQIGTLQPGRGYFLGFYCGPGRNYDHTWPLNPEWNNTNSLEPEPAGPSHFQFQPYTHWCYAVLIDTVDLAQTPLETGDEIAVFDGDLCVGAVSYTGSFPLLLNTWQDDIATPVTLDGYVVGHEMTFKWYDASENTEAEFILPPTTYSEDDPVTPSHSGFGRGAYGIRSFSQGVQQVQQLPQAFRLGQNYPNPFNAETIIPLELPQRSHVKIELFNVQGRSLGVIFEDTVNAGWPKIHYNGLGHASGMYFCRVTAEGLEREGRYQSVGKLLLLR